MSFFGYTDRKRTICSKPHVKVSAAQKTYRIHANALSPIEVLFDWSVLINFQLTFLFYKFIAAGSGGSGEVNRTATNYYDYDIASFAKECVWLEWVNVLMAMRNLTKIIEFASNTDMHGWTRRSIGVSVILCFLGWALSEGLNLRCIGVHQNGETPPRIYPHPRLLFLGASGRLRFLKIEALPNHVIVAGESSVANTRFT